MRCSSAPPLFDSQREELLEIKQAGSLAVSVTHHILDVSRPGETGEFLVCDTNAILGRLEVVFGRILGDDIVLTLACDPTVGFLQADQGQLGQVLLNLLVNARDAMPKGGTVTIRTENAEYEPAQSPAFDVSPGEYIRISVSDTGIGMSDVVAARIFEPFYTTKAPESGTGLGLSTVHAIVKQLGGGIVVESLPGRGSTFVVSLPRVELESIHPEKPEIRVGESGFLVLLVEESPTLLGLMSDSLRLAGFAVLPAETGPAAIELASGTDRAIQLLVSDVVAGDLHTSAVIRTLMPENPGMEVLFTSAYSEIELRKNGVKDPVSQVLKKPFTENELVSRVKEIAAKKE